MKSDWNIKINKADNGFVLEWEEVDEDENSTKTVINHSKVIEESDEDNGELIAMQNLLWEVAEHFGVSYSKHNKFNLNIEVKENKDEL